MRKYSCKAEKPSADRQTDKKGKDIMEEIWKPIREHRRVITEVSDKGLIRTRSKKTGEIRSRPFPGYFNKWTGYYQIRDGMGVHRLVAEAFIPNPDGKQ